MRIVITGVNGQLGTELLEVLKTEQVQGFGKEQLDITRALNVHHCIEDTKPELVIHCAAYTNVDGCESDANLAYGVNALGAGNVAAECLKTGAAMVYLSTDYVFDGQKGQPYYEFDQPNPISEYGKTKFAGEEIIRNTLREAYIIRTAWLYGKQGKNFVKTMLELAETRKLIDVVNDQIGSPTNAADLAKAIAMLIQSRKYGTYHVTNSGSCSWYEFAKKIFQIKNIDVEVRSVTSEELNRPAKRPAYSVLKNFNLEANLNYRMRPWEDALSEYLTAK